MIEIQEISLEKKELLNQYVKDSSISDFTFTNLFLWKDVYNTKYFILSNTLCIIENDEPNIRYISFPIGNTNSVKGVVEEIISYFYKLGEKVNITLYNEESKEKLDQLFPQKFVVTERADNFDYIYEVKELIELNGKKYHKKRNHVNNFKLLYNYEYRKITMDNIMDCKKLFDAWYNSKNETNGLGTAAKEAIYGLIYNFNNLDIIGGGIYVDGKMVAFSFGEKLNSDMVIIYYEYADVSYEGAYQMMNQQFLENEWSSFTYVNRECDLGIEGLRKAKLSYHPIFMAKKYIARNQYEIL